MSSTHVNEPVQCHPQLNDALSSLRRCGYAVGLPAQSAQGTVTVTVAGRAMSQEDIFGLAGMDRAACEASVLRRPQQVT